jgi:hypothetical protein
VVIIKVPVVTGKCPANFTGHQIMQDVYILPDIGISLSGRPAHPYSFKSIPVSARPS